MFKKMNFQAGSSETEAPTVSTVIGETRKSKNNDALNSKRGVIKFEHKWDDFEKILHQVYYKELHIESEKYPLFLTENPVISKSDRERMIQIAFETFNVPGYYQQSTLLLSLYASGLLSGCMVESGEKATYIAPISEGYIIPDTMQSFPLAGKALSSYLRQLLCCQQHPQQEQNTHYETTIEEEQQNQNLFSSMFEEENLIRQIKASCCFVNTSNDIVVIGDENNESHEKLVNGHESDNLSYQLPDGQSITLQKERYLCPECFFRPSLLQEVETVFCGGSSATNCSNTAEITIFNDLLNSITSITNLPDHIVQVIQQCDSTIQSMLLTNIAVAGGSTLFPGFTKRLTSELQLRLPTSEIGMIAKEERGYAAWLGGALIASTSSFPTIVINRAEYDEYGPKIVHQKCF
jgi:actin, other eukaryote